jgi:chromosome partitioning protein
LLRVMFDPRITLQQQVSDQLKAHFGDKVFDTVIPRNVRLAEAPSYGLPGVVFDPSAKGSVAFVAFAKELVEKMPPASALQSPSAPPDDGPVVGVSTASATGVADKASGVQPEVQNHNGG